VDWVCSSCGRHFNWSVNCCPYCQYTPTVTTGGTQPTDVQHAQVKMPSWGDVTRDITFSTVGERDVAAEVFSRVARHFGYA